MNQEDLVKSDSLVQSQNPRSQSGQKQPVAKLEPSFPGASSVNDGHTPFDPFQDRLSRDIRNQLSESIIPCLRALDIEPARAVGNRFLALPLGPEQVNYIQRRLALYARFLARIAEGPDDVLWRGLVLWDLGLHFEVHEILEHAWHRSQGEEKLLLQAMIRAAGVYIKSDYGYIEAAAKLASKAMPVLERQRQRLAVYIEPERLYTAMRTPVSPAPVLLN